VIPVWLLDIDGVINAYGAASGPPTHVWPKADWIITKAHGFNIWASNSVVTFIRNIHDNGQAEIRWHTTWQNHAELLADALHLPTFPVQDAPEYGSYDHDFAMGWWKLPPVHRVLAEGRSVLWTDDDADSLSIKELADLQEAGPIEVIAPHYDTGLCLRHLRQIKRFLEAGS